MQADATRPLVRILLVAAGGALLTVHPATASATCARENEIRAAFVAMQGGDFNRGVTLLSRLNSVAPACDPDQYHLLAVAWLNLRANEKALAVVERGLTIFPLSTELQAYYVSVLTFTCSKNQAIDRLEKALAGAPQSVILRNALARTLLDIDPESERAGHLLDQLVKEEPQDVECRGNYARYLLAVHRDALAERQLDEALKDAPQEPDVQVDLYRLSAVIEDRLNHEDRADEAYRKAIDWNAKRTKASYSAALEYAEFLMRRSKNEQAKTVLSDLVSTYPNLGLAYFDLARILARETDYETAIEQASRALEYAPDPRDQKPIRVFLAKTYHLAGHEAEARVQQDWVASH